MDIERRWGAFCSRIDVNGPVPVRRPDLGPCWLWTGAQSHGYGFYDRLPAHTWVFEQARGTVPNRRKQPVDHLCRTLLCVNLAHLERVTGWTNVVERGIGPSALNARKTECRNGHPFTAANTYVNPKGERVCRICQKEYRLRWFNAGDNGKKANRRAYLKRQARTASDQG